MFKNSLPYLFVVVVIKDFKDWGHQTFTDTFLENATLPVKHC